MTQFAGPGTGTVAVDVLLVRQFTQAELSA